MEMSEEAKGGKLWAAGGLGLRIGHTERSAAWEGFEI